MSFLKRVDISKTPPAFLKGLQGAAGKDGLIGRDGRDGKDGIDGIGRDGIDGKDGLNGVGVRGDRGIMGEKGEAGPPPKHQVENNEIRFQNQDGTWGDWIGVTHAPQQTSGGGGSASVEQTNDLQRQLDDMAAARDKLIDTVGNLTYIGEAEPGSLTSEAKWRIKRVEDKGGDDIDIRHADGVNTFNKIWDDRLTFTY